MYIKLNSKVKKKPFRTELYKSTSNYQWCTVNLSLSTDVLRRLSCRLKLS